MIGSLALFKKIWKEHTEIEEFGASGHPTCDDCAGRQVPPPPVTRHPACRDCSHFTVLSVFSIPSLTVISITPCPPLVKVRRDALEGRTDAQAVELRSNMDEVEAVHTGEHMGERRYAEDASYQGETYPHRVTCIRVDAPTQHQFDLPR